VTISASKSISVTFFTGIVERFLKKYPFPSTENRKSVITTVKGIGLTVPESNLVKCQEENKKDFLEKG